MASFIRRLFGGGSRSTPAPAPAPKPAPQKLGPTPAQIAQSVQKRKGKTTYTDALGLSTGQKSNTNLKTLTGA